MTDALGSPASRPEQQDLLLPSLLPCRVSFVQKLTALLHEAPVPTEGGVAEALCLRNDGHGSTSDMHSSIS